MGIAVAGSLCVVVLGLIALTGTMHEGPAVSLQEVVGYPMQPSNGAHVDSDYQQALQMIAERERLASLAQQGSEIINHDLESIVRSKQQGASVDAIQSQVAQLSRDVHEASQVKAAFNNIRRFVRRASPAQAMQAEAAAAAQANNGGVYSPTKQVPGEYREPTNHDDERRRRVSVESQPEEPEQEEEQHHIIIRDVSSLGDNRPVQEKQAGEAEHPKRIPTIIRNVGDSNKEQFEKEVAADQSQEDIVREAQASIREAQEAEARLQAQAERMENVEEALQEYAEHLAHQKARLDRMASRQAAIARSQETVGEQQHVVGETQRRISEAQKHIADAQHRFSVKLHKEWARQAAAMAAKHRAEAAEEDETPEEYNHQENHEAAAPAPGHLHLHIEHGSGVTIDVNAKKEVPMPPQAK